MKPEDFTKERFLLKLPLYADRSRVFQLIATARGLECWFLGKVDFIRGQDGLLPDGSALQAGDDYSWTWQKGYSIRGKVLDFADGERFEFSFGGPFTVHFRLNERAADKITELELVQRNSDPSPANEFGFLNCCVCWTFFLTNLKSVAEQGVDLRESEFFDESFINQ
jgi:hypothetical protein